MANIPPKKFYSLTKLEQEDYAVKKMNENYEAAEQWKKVAQKARRMKIVEPDERPDELILKHEN